MLWRRQSSLVKPLEPSSWAALADGPKTLMPASARRSARPADQRHLGADHDEVDLLALGERHLARDVLGGDVDAFGHLGDAGIAGAQ